MLRLRQPALAIPLLAIYLAQAVVVSVLHHHGGTRSPCCTGEVDFMPAHVCSVHDDVRGQRCSSSHAPVSNAVASSAGSAACDAHSAAHVGSEGAYCGSSSDAGERCRHAADCAICRFLALTPLLACPPLECASERVAGPVVVRPATKAVSTPYGLPQARSPPLAV